MDQERIWAYYQNESGADVFSDSFPRYRYLAKIIPTGGSVLNIGVGRGGFERVLLEKGGLLVFSLDPSAQAIQNLRDQLGLAERAQVGYSQDIPFPDHSFDAVVMTEVLEHLKDDVLSASLGEVRRVLKSGGRFIGTVPANEVLSGNQVFCPNCGHSFHKWGHEQQFSEARLKTMLVDAGFGEVEVMTRAIVNWKRKGVGNFLKSMVRYLLGRFGSTIACPNLIFVARKDI